MFPEWLSAFPAWLLYGLAVGGAASLFVAGAFVVGDRLFPTPPIDGSARIDGTTRRRREIRDFLLRTDERFLEDEVVHGDTVAFYLPDREVAITFDAQAYFRIRRAGTFAVLCEYEMPGVHLGRRLPFEVPEVEPSPTASTPVRTAFALFDLPTTASPEQVKSAYRTQVKDAHPDHGGDATEFRRLREAYTTARDYADASTEPVEAST